MDQQLVDHVAHAIEHRHDDGRAWDTCARFAITEVANYLTQTGHSQTADALLDRLTIDGRTVVLNS